MLEGENGGEAVYLCGGDVYICGGCMCDSGAGVGEHFGILAFTYCLHPPFSKYTKSYLGATLSLSISLSLRVSLPISVSCSQTAHSIHFNELFLKKYEINAIIL